MQTSYGPRDCNLPYIISTLLYIKIYQIVRKHQLQIQIQQQPAMQTVIVDHKQNLARWKRST